MKILLSKIKPSRYQSRSRINGQPLRELQKSMGEIGLLVPIKVRPLGDAYEAVFGHRRLQAAKNLGWKKIEAIVSELTDKQVMLQGLAENILDENLEQMDQARAFARLSDEFGMSNREIAREIGVDESWVRNLTDLLKQPEEVMEMLEEESADDEGALDERIDEEEAEEEKFKITEYHIRLVKTLGLDDETYVALLKKAETEELTSDRTREVGRCLVIANTAKLKKHLIETEFDSFTHDPERIKDVVEKRAGVDPTIRERPKVKQWEKAVADFLRYMKQMRWWVEDFEKAVDGDQLSPEAKPFVATRLKTLRNDINRVLDKLEE